MAERPHGSQTGGGPPPFAAPQVVAVAALLAGILTALSPRYGFHRDELYFLVAGDHPAWGYTDQPPFTPLAARASTAVFGTSPQGLRVPATLAAAAVVVLVALAARELGGGRRAQVLAAALTACCGYVLAVGHLMVTATFDLLAWTAVALAALRLLRTGDRRWWAALGLLAGLAALNKDLVALLAVALLAGVLATGPRAVLRGWWPVAGAALALLVAAPNLWWQARHGWPQLTVAGGISDDDGAENRILFVPLQLAYLSPFLVPVWVAGGLRMWREPALRWSRPFVAGYGVLAALVVATGGKPYYALPLLLVWTAAGCLPLARFLRSAGRRALGGAVLVLAAANSAFIALPVLPVSAIGAANAVNPEQGEQIGWPALADAAAAGWARVPAADRARAVLFAQNYGEAGALALYGPARGLPAPYSGHMAFAGWGPPPDSRDGPVLIVAQRDATGFEARFRACREVARARTGADNEEDGALVVLCSGTRKPWSVLWPELRHFY
ncbi:glycosyltransferase family 39 protein [Actinomadura parmotrematis]|uniref:Glycosyltransferase family 39 protein n=1 Tax=Actinomadura parmotrematis TaxID=2864039 RepID=A0ABS7G4A0_9ACTN|nr:glycosyltransferase family 39 protein [Actinomadura parmotrematis]MBW8486684.1 glycosyltransferase family 39 protein [Actinomadura parmotrematis]